MTNFCGIIYYKKYSQPLFSYFINIELNGISCGFCNNDQQKKTL